MGERIIAIGELKRVKKELGNEYEMIDLKGKTLIPGFIDCHLHPIQFLLHILNPDLSDVKRLEDLQSILKKAVEEKSADELTIGFNFCEEKFDNPILPTRWDLDNACPNKPVFILRYDSSILANSDYGYLYREFDSVKLRNIIGYSLWRLRNHND